MHLKYRRGLVQSDFSEPDSNRVERHHGVMIHVGLDEVTEARYLGMIIGRCDHARRMQRYASDLTVREPAASRRESTRSPRCRIQALRPA